MTSASLAIMMVSGALLLFLPRRSAAIPLLLASAYTTRLPVVELGPASLSILRILVLVGVVRVVLRGERVANGLNAVDRLLIAWAVVLIGTSIFHTSDALTYRLGTVLGELGVYGLCRVFVQDAEDIRRLFRFLCVALIPLAVLMLLEKYTAQNLFTFVGTSGAVDMREGHVRASGPFAHAILAGVAGATLFPMAVAVWKVHRRSALIGLTAGAGIVFASTSSGPIMMAAFACLGLLAWRLQNVLRLIRWGTVAAIVALDIVMNDPVYFLMARIDITGGSTGYYRSQLIRSSIEHLNEWWAAGTDVTRHWMATGIYANSNHADIVNHYLAMGVAGGLPLMILFILVLRAGFHEVGRALGRADSFEHRYLSWTLGAILFGYVMSFWAISPYDQSASFFYLILATIGATHLRAVVNARPVLVDRPAATPNTRFARSVAALTGQKGLPGLAESPASLQTRGWAIRRRAFDVPRRNSRQATAQTRRLPR